MNSRQACLSVAEITNRLPSRFHLEWSEPFPADLIGATIIAIGTLKDATLVEGGGLVIEYQTKEAESIRRLVFGFSDLGMYLENPCYP